MTAAGRKLIGRRSGDLMTTSRLKNLEIEIGKESAIATVTKIAIESAVETTVVTPTKANTASATKKAFHRHPSPRRRG
jgi:hypothetical protein